VDALKVKPLEKIGKGKASDSYEMGKLVQTSPQRPSDMGGFLHRTS
jgi:hypothetical protein